MKIKQVDRLLLVISIACFFLMAVSFLLMPVDKLVILPGLLFWMGLAGGVTLQVILEARRRAFFAAFHVRRQRMQKPRNGFLTFGSNKYAVAADYILLGSFLCMVLALILTKGLGYVCYVTISLTVFSLCMHCILNGRIYFHVMNQNKIRQALEQKKVRTVSKGEGRK